MKIEINNPETLNDIKLGNYQSFLKLENPQEADIISNLLELDKSVVPLIKDKVFNSLVSNVNSLFEQEHKFADRFTLNGVTYGFIPNLDDITYGENKDVTSYISEWGNMHKAMAVMYRPITNSFNDKYLIEQYKGSRKYSEVMKDAPLGVVFGAMVFFWNLTNDLLNCIPNYLEKVAKEEQTKGQISVENGVAIQNSVRLLKEMLQDLTKLQGYPFTNATHI